jgi:hypothetical protein
MTLRRGKMAHGRSVGIDRSRSPRWAPSPYPRRRVVVVRYRRAKGLTLAQLRRILSTEPVLQRHPSATEKILKRAAEALSRRKREK